MFGFDLTWMSSASMMKVLNEILVALDERGRKVSDCENVKTTYRGDGRPEFRYCGKCPMCRIWKAVERLGYDEDLAPVRSVVK